MFNFFVALQILGICVILIALGLLVNGDGSREQKLMICFTVGSLCHNVAYLLELTAKTKEAAMTAVKMEYLGSTYIALFFCWFMYAFCKEKAPERLLKALFWVDTALLAVVFTCEAHQFYYRRVDWVMEDRVHPSLSLTYGPAFYIYLLFAVFIPYVFSVYVLIRSVITKSNHETVRIYKVFIVLTLLPVTALFTYIFRLTNGYDPTPVVFGTTLSMVVILVWSKRNFDFSRMAAEVVIHNMDDGVIMLNQLKRIVNYNAAAANIFTELSFQTTGDSIEDMEDFPEGILDEDVRREFKLNNRYYESHVKQIPDKNGTLQGYVILVLDVTETRKYIDEIKKVREQAEKANMAKSEFLANMSHEIRTPMNAIVGLSDIIMEESRGRKVYNYACDIKSASRNLLTIINDILDLSKVEAGKMELVTNDYYIKAVVGDVVNMMDIAASQRGLTLKYEYDDSIPCRYHGDEGRIKQILINIMNNAVKFTKVGYVKISVGGCPGNEPDTEMLSFSVEDTGCGIKQEDIEKIFEDFRQVDSKRNRGVEGTGLGLSITKRLVQLMKGTIEVQSVYGKGSTFVIKLPQKIVDRHSLKEVPEVPVRRAEVTETFIVNNYKVLVVDDNLINRKVAIGVLKNYGFDLSEAESGFEAIDMVKKTRFNMIFMDHMMPGMDGIETVRIIREECGVNGRTPIIIALTANAMEGVREKFLQSGFQDFISKPLDRKPLNEILTKWIPDTYKREKSLKHKEPQKVQLRYEDISISGIDVEEAKKHHTGDVEDYLELLKLYCMDGKRKCKLLGELMEGRDYDNYRIEVHGLKSASANIGAMELSTQAREHEEAANRKDEEFIKWHFSELLTCYEMQIQSIESFLKNRDNVAGDNESDQVVSIDNQSILRETREALTQLENFHSKECVGIVEGLLKYKIDYYTESKLTEIKEQLQLYEDDEAERLLHRLIDWLEKEE